jgi:hypothetical protein
MVRRSVILTLVLSLMAAFGTRVYAQALPDAMVVSPAAATGTSAVQRAVEASGSTYGGDCAAARSPDSIGTVCSKLVETSGQVSAYMTGRAFSEFTSWVFVAETSSGWCTLATTPLDGSTMTSSIPWPANTGTIAPCSGFDHLTANVLG